MSQFTTLAIVTIVGSGEATELQLIREQRNNLTLAITDVRVEDAKVAMPQQRSRDRESMVCEMLKTLEHDGTLRPFVEPFCCASPSEYRRLYTVLGIAS